MRPTAESNNSGTEVVVSRVSSQKRAPSVPAPLTFQQECMLKHMVHADVPHPVFGAFRLRGALNIDILCKSLSLVVARHESLRTRIIEISDVPMQVVDESSEFPLKVLRLSGHALEAEAQEILREFAWTRIALESGP